MFTIDARDPASRARRGTLHLAHGDVATPAFVPLATRGAVKTLEPRDVEALGYEMVLGNTFHLFLAPGPELIDRARRPEPRSCAGSGRSSPTPAAFRSSRWATAASPTRSRAAAGPRPAEPPTGRSWRSRRRACAFAPTSTARERFIGPETSMAVQAALGSDIALVFDECTPFHVTRDYTARSMERTHRWLERCLRWHGEHGPAGQAVYGIVQGGDRARPAHESRCRRSPPAHCDGIAIGGSLGQDKAQMHEVVRLAPRPSSSGVAPDRPRHLLGIGEIDDLIAGVRGWGSTPSTARCRPGWAATASAIVPDPDGRWRLDLVKSRWRDGRRADPRRLPVPGLRGRLLPRLPALPAARPRDDRRAAGHPAQPQLHRSG